MDLPRRYSYNARPGIMLLCILFFGLGGVVLGWRAMNPEPIRILFIRLEPAAASIFFWILVVCSGLFVLAGIATIIRGIVEPKTLELGIDALLLPNGFMMREIVQIPYRDMGAISEVTVSGQKFLYIYAAPDGRRFTLVAGQLPSNAAYEEVREFLFTVTTPA